MRAAERLTNAIAVNCILAWRIYWMTMIGREAPDLPAHLAFTTTELEILDRLAPARTARATSGGLGARVTQLARLGGFLARKRDGPPGNLVIWRGLVRLAAQHRLGTREPVMRQDETWAAVSPRQQLVPRPRTPVRRVGLERYRQRPTVAGLPSRRGSDRPCRTRPPATETD